MTPTFNNNENVSTLVVCKHYNENLKLRRNADNRITSARMFLIKKYFLKNFSKNLLSELLSLSTRKLCMVMFLLNFVKGSKSAEGGPNPLADIDRGSISANGFGPGDPILGGSKSARTAAADILRQGRKLQAAYITYGIRNFSKSKRALHHRDHIDGDMTKKWLSLTHFAILHLHILLL